MRPDWRAVAARLAAERKEMTPEQVEAEKLERAERLAVEREITDKSAKSSTWLNVVGSEQAGRRYADCTLDNFEIEYPERQRPAIAQIRGFMANIEDHTKNCRGLVLYGPCGTGKDHLAVACLREAFWDHDLSVRFVYGRDFIILARDRIHFDREGEMIWLKKYTSPDILCISDPLPPDGELNANQISLLMTLIHHRYRDMRPTWLTLNAEEWDIKTQGGLKTASRLSIPVFDRLSDETTLVRCEWKTRRQPRKAITSDKHPSNRPR